MHIEANVVTPPLPDGYTTPSEYEATLTWANGVKQFVRTTTADSPYGQILDQNGQRNGVKLVGTDGWIWVNRSGIDASNKDLLHTPLPEGSIKLEVSRNHMGNFIDAVKSRRDPIASVENGHRSAVIGHLIIIALRTGLKLDWDAQKEVFTGEGADTANKYLAREMRKPYDYSFVS